jgi:biofilm protein TabA
MIIDITANSSRYTGLHPLFPKVFEYIKKTDLLTLASGKHSIVGDDLFVIVEHAQGRSRESAKLECHRKYIDIQLVLAGIDEMGWLALKNCHKPIDDFCAVNDYQLFDDIPTTWVATPPEAFCIFFPDDAHAPLVSTDEIHKVIFKVAVNPSQ